MRSRPLHTAAVLTIAVAALTWLPSETVASVAPAGSTAPLAAVQAAQPAPLLDSVVGLPLEEARDHVEETAVALRVTVLQKQTDDRNLAGAKVAVQELRDEASEIAATTVESAVTNYRQTDLDEGLFELEDLNEGLRANALGDAAIVADTKTFDRYRDKIKDLELAEFNLAAEVIENENLAGVVAQLQLQLEAEQSWLGDMEERAIHRSAHTESIVESGWAQALGSKQGFYLRTCPVKGAHSFIDSWGFPRSGGRRHKGVDILADIGTPIVAPVDGVVSFRSNRVGGRSFHLTAENGNYFYGTHLSAYGDVEGEVRAGQVIGYVGDDGNAAGIPHLHFEIHPGGRGNQINPFVDSAAVCDGAQH